MCTHWNSKGVDLSICDFDQGKSCRYIGLPPMVGNYIISNICQVTTTCCRSRLRPEGKKGFSFSLFMGARRQFEEMPNKKVKSGELRNKNLAITARARFHF